ncbi:MAG: hypothetical protein Ta2F_08630 [Termitinemataceae bacterium]|nr:MAG: hypothetical protein Ta2F_08630 [Termitinemataceae bacterium]
MLRSTPLTRKITSPAGICILYPLAGGILITIFRLIFPRSSEVTLLPCFTLGNSLACGFLDFITFFPALFMSALVIPFGRKSKTEKEYGRFSPEFLALLKPSIVASIVAAVFYGVLFLMFRPLVSDYQVDIKVKTQLFKISKEKTEEFSRTEQWSEAAHFLTICDRIWPAATGFDNLRERVSTGLEKQIYGARDAAKKNEVKNSGNGIPSFTGVNSSLSATDALNASRRAYREERYYDAHRLAVIAGHLTKDGDAEKQAAALEASRAWNAISRLEPSQEDRDRYSIYSEKREAYEALNSEDWIRAYYIFMDLAQKVPSDPDVQKYLKESEDGLNSVVFFLDEMEAHTGDELINPVFSIPMPDREGRIVMRFSSLTSTADFSYGKDMEIVAFDKMRKPIYRVVSPYIKILPVMLGSYSETVIYMKSIDRYDETKHWDPIWNRIGAATDLSAAQNRTLQLDTQILLNISFDQFLLASVADVNYAGFYLRDLWESANTLEPFGYIPQVFYVEIIRCMTDPLLFLPLAMVSLIIGWALRTRKKTGDSFYLMCAVLPIVFNGFVFILRQVFYDLELFTVLSFGFAVAIPICIAGSAVLFILSLLCLAAQNG